MPPNKPQTALSLEGFRQVINWHPFQFWQLSNPIVPLTDSAEPVAVEYTWQKPMAASRSDFRRAIQTAEQKLCDLLGYDVSTRYREQAVDPGYLRSGFNPAGRYGYGYGYFPGGPGFYGYGGGNGYGYGYGYGYASPLIQLEVGKLQRVATVSYTALTDFAVTITDEDGDGVKDTFTGTFANTDLDPQALVITFSEDDQLSTSALSAATSDPVDWLVRPITITRKDASTLQVVGPSWLIVKPALYEKAGPAAGYNSSQTPTGVNSSGTFDPNDATTYVGTLAAWQKVYSNENQATFVRRFGGNEYTFQTTVTVVDADLGQVQLDLLGCLNGVPPCVGAGTDELRINYEAGATGPDYKRYSYLKYQTDWETLVARFAIAELPQSPAATQRQNPMLAYYREDLARTGSVNAGETYRISNDILNNPFRNTRRGAVEAFQAVSSLAQHRAVNF